jgi:transposase
MIDLRFVDESSFNMRPNVPYGWVKKGEQQTLPASRQKALNVFGLMSLGQKLTSYTTTQNVNAERVISWLEDFITTIDKVTVLVMDNASWHTAKKMMDKLDEWEQKNLFIFFLPPYSPHLNFIEILWRRIKYHWLKAQDYACVKTLRNAIKNILQNFGSKYTLYFQNMMQKLVV